MSATRSLPSNNVTSAMLEKRNADLKRFTGMKAAVCRVEGKGAVPVPATAEIDKQITLKAQRHR